MDRFSFFSVCWIRSTEMGHRVVPVMLFDGEPAIGVNQWLYGLILGGMPPSTLETYIRAIGHLYDFNKALQIVEGADYDPAQLLAKFVDAKRYGTDEQCRSESHPYLKSLFLGWSPVTTSSIKRNYLNPINDFDKWQHTFHGADRLNPSEEVFLTQYEKFLDFKQRSGWDVFLHLAPARSKTKEVHQVNLDDRRHRRLNRVKSKVAKAFPAERFIELIETLKNPRDKLLVLMYGGGSLRRSEPLHIFLSDIKGVDKYGQLIVRLEDPVLGKVEWEGPDGKLRMTTREKYFQECFKNEHLPEGHLLRNLMPRDTYINRNSALHVGFKGMTFAEGGLSVSGETEANDMYWCTPEIGRYAAQVFHEYYSEYILANPHDSSSNPNGWPYHPWLFINIKKEVYGNPLTTSAVKKLWNSALARMGLSGKGYGLHSLRHLFGFYCANVLGLPMETLQCFLHHSSVASTQVYYHLSDDSIRHALLEAAGAVPAHSLLTLNGQYQYDYPKHWNVENDNVHPFIQRLR